MKFGLMLTLGLTVAIVVAGCNDKATDTHPVVESASWKAIAATLTIAEKQVDTVVEWNTKTGEARLLNAASFADKATGQQGNLIGWVPLTDLNQAVQNLATQIQARGAIKEATPASTPLKVKNDVSEMPRDPRSPTGHW